MGRKVFGPVRQAAYDAAVAARQAAEKTADQAQKSLFTLTAKSMDVLEQACGVLDDVSEGKIKLKVWGKVMPIELLWDIKEEDK